MSTPTTKESNDMKTPTNEPKHTAISPLPWRCEREGAEDIVLRCADYPVAHIHHDTRDTAEMDANAQFICTAVNSHRELKEQNAELREACRAAESALLSLKNQCSDKEWAECWQDLPDTLRKLTALLSKIGGGK